MGLKDRNNPLGQRNPSDKVGGPAPHLKHGQSADLVEEIKEKAKIESQKSSQKKNPSEPQPGVYDPTGPDRQPGRVMPQKDLGKNPRQPQQGQYTQDNEEEPENV